MSLIITFSFYQSCFLISLLFYVFPELQVIALDFVFVLHNNNDHHLDYDCLHFRLRQSMQLPGTTDCQITSVGEDRNQLLEHHEHPNSKSLLMLLRKALGECGGNCCCQSWLLQVLCLCLHYAGASNTRSFLILKPHGLPTWNRWKASLLVSQNSPWIRADYGYFVFHFFHLKKGLLFLARPLMSMRWHRGNYYIWPQGIHHHCVCIWVLLVSRTSDIYIGERISGF